MRVSGPRISYLESDRFSTGIALTARIHAPLPRNRPRHWEAATVRRILPFLSVGYVIYALLIAWFICRLLFVFTGQVHWPDAIVRHPVDAARYDLVFAFAFIGICLASHCSFQHGAGDAARWCLPAFRVSLFLSARF